MKRIRSMKNYPGTKREVSFMKTSVKSSLKA